MNWNIARLVLGILALIAMILLGPWCFIWGLNTVFDLGIEWTWKMWFGVHAIFLMVRIGSTS